MSSRHLSKIRRSLPLRHLTFIAAALVLGAVCTASPATRLQPAPSSAPQPHTLLAGSKKSYEPASVLAQPDLECKIYAAGGSAEGALVVFTDDDGYARFHAVRATARDAIQQLSLACTDQSGHASDYLVDLTAPQTFVSRPLGIAAERGTDRLALTADPLDYSQEELLKMGYGLRPDAENEPQAYARWLAAAQAPARMLEGRRASRRSWTVFKTTAPNWTGSALIGKPNYELIEGNLSVPHVIPGGDETNATHLAIWNGLGGLAGSGLIQGGVQIGTNSLVATYTTFREYCCGDPDSNSRGGVPYGGTFTPNPGDTIYSEQWYCDASGKRDLNGGYGCSHLHDLNTGAVFDCSSATSATCWSVKALPLCSASPKTKNCMTLGLSAESVIELQAAAWTDLKDEVTITGSAYSSKTGKNSQTVGNDPEVDLLIDFANSSTHMNVSLGKTDQTHFSVSQFQQVSGAAAEPFMGESLAVGPNAKGSTVGDAWVLGTTKVGSDYEIFRWEDNVWVKQTGVATHIAVSPAGTPWIINSLGDVSYWDGSAYKAAPSACASWIAVGPGSSSLKYGDPWILGCTLHGNGYDIYELQGSKWVKQRGVAVRMATGPLGPWIVNGLGEVYFWNGASFSAAPGAPPCASDIAVGPLADPLPQPLGAAWITGCDLAGSGYHVYQLQSGSTWVSVPGLATQIAVSPDFGIPWLINGSGEIYE